MAGSHGIERHQCRQYGARHYSIAALKVRELPEADPNASAMSINEAGTGRTESELGRLADGLEPEQAAKGLELHEQFIGTSRRLF